MTYQHRDMWNKMEELRNSDIYQKCFSEKFFSQDNSYVSLAPILYFLTLYRKADDILNKTAKVDNVDLYITKYVRNFKKDEILADLELLNKIFEKIVSLNIRESNKIFNANGRYSDTVFGAITLGMAFNFDNLPEDIQLKDKINEAGTKLSQDGIATRGFSASARIPKMIDFAKNYFA